MNSTATHDPRALFALICAILVIGPLAVYHFTGYFNGRYDHQED